MRASRLLAVCAIVLAGAAGLTCAFALGPGAASAALADEPTTTSTPPTTTEPTPDPAPPRKPKPKPKPAPARPPAPTSYRSTPAPVVSSPSPSSTPRPRAHPKAKKVHRKVHVKPKAALPKVKVSKALGAIAGVRNATEVKGGGSADVSSLLIVMGLAFAIACFAMAVIPATHVPWRPAAIFVSERQVDLTVVGLVLFLVAGFTFFWTRGP